MRILFRSWFEKNKYQKGSCHWGNLNIDGIVDDTKEILLILLGVVIALCLCE